jgi:adenylate cyclase
MVAIIMNKNYIVFSLLIIVGTRKFAFGIWGDTVNLVARMEQNGEPGKINISERTYELVRNKFHYTHRGRSR